MIKTRFKWYFDDFSRLLYIVDTNSIIDIQEYLIKKYVLKYN